ncbi:MAG: magnesium transporter [Oscillospiraceae bacterium]|nr:magnesium transporter [Oscillospiraceae bacterium]
MKEKVLNYINAKDMANLKALLANAEIIEVLQIFSDLPKDEQVIVFRLLAKDAALAVFEQLDSSLQQILLRSFTDDRAIEFVNEMAPDDRMRLLDELPAGVAAKLLESLSQEERESTNVLMGYEPKTAGRIMTTEYISLEKDTTAEQALKKVRRQARDKETIYTLFVTDNARKLEGVLSLKELLVANGDSQIEDIMSKKAISVSTGTDREEVAKILQEFDLLAVPVVDNEGRLVGIVTIDDAVDILEEEATEDIFYQAGIVGDTSREADRSEVLIHGSMWRIWRVRLPFLLITLAAGMFAGVVVAGFEEALESIAAVAIFIPLIMDMGGNVGTQSSTVFVRGVVLGHIDMRNFLKHIMKEIGIGLSMGVMAGSVAGVIAAVWKGMPMLGLAVGFSVMFTMALAAFLGFLIPYVLTKLNVDQAAGSAPIITSIKDVAGLLIYFLLVIAFLGHLM